MAIKESAWKQPATNPQLRAIGSDESRLHKRVASTLIKELQSGKFAIGDKMPAERDLALRMKVSRPVIREAMLALEVLGLIEVRIGAGTFVVRPPGETDKPRFNVSPFELLVLPVVEEHMAIVEALKHRDPKAARTAMRAHLESVIKHLLLAVEEQALTEARRSVASTRERFGGVARI